MNLKKVAIMLKKMVIALLFCSMPTECYLIAWDLGDTLIYVSKLYMASYIGALDCIWYHMRYSKFDREHLQNLLFDVLEEYGGKQEGDKHSISLYGERRPVPKILFDWLAGNAPHHKKLIKKIHKKIDELASRDYFRNELEVRVVKNAINAMFTPEILVSCTGVLKEALELVAEIAQKGVHQQTIISNLDAHTFEQLKKSPAGKELSRYFNLDAIIISGVELCAKPHDDIYDILLEQYPLAADQIIVIDDQSENVAAARRKGMSGLQVKKHDFKRLRKEFVALGVL